MKKPSARDERRARVGKFSHLELSPENLGAVLTSFLDDSTPIQKLVKDCVARGDFMSLVKLSVDPRVYGDPEVYFWDRQATELLRKYPFPGMEETARNAAIETFLKSDSDCTRTNVRFTASSEHLFAADERNLIKQVRRHIRYVLGRFDSNEMIDEARHGPGTCRGLEALGFRGHGCVGGEFKFESKITLTATLVPYASAILREYPLWDAASVAAHGAENRFQLVDGNAVTTVPKSALTDRTIAIEPMLNVFLQLGVGGMVRRRLSSRGGFNLDESWKRNQALAKKGSIDGSYSTIDLSNASDTIAFNVVGTLLPKDWFTVLERLRSPVGTYRIGTEQKTRVYQKFSSMGNGTTFELETLIFWAICRACGVPPSDLAVFGDDIVVPVAYTTAVLQALEFFGFTPNLAKTFTTGPFRESCGTDYFLGRDVRPLYLTKEVNNGQKIVNFANAIRDLGVRRNQACGYNDHSSDIRLASGWHYVVGCIPRDIRNEISSPPYTAYGLWKGDLAHATDPSGGYLPRWMYFPVPAKAPVSFVGLGLLAARLSSATLTTWKTKPWEGPFSFKVEEGIGGGNSSDLSRQVRWKSRKAVDSGSLEQWGGWA